MSYTYKRRSKNAPKRKKVSDYLQYSSKTIESKIEIISEKIANCRIVQQQKQADSEHYCSLDKERLNIYNEIAQLDERICEIKKNPKNKFGLLDRLCGKGEYLQGVTDEINSLEWQKNKLQSEIPAIEAQKLNLRNNSYIVITKEIKGYGVEKYLQTVINNLEEDRIVLEQALSQVIDKEKKEELKSIIEKEKKYQIKEQTKILRARVAAADKESRKLAESVKKEIKHQQLIFNECPYCGRELGNNAVADHIYPICKGGHSTVKNMVYVCYTCNRDKKDLTLREYVKRYNLNREFIEAALEKLDKTF